MLQPAGEKKEKNLQEFLTDVDLQKRSPADGESVGLQMASFCSWKRIYLLRVSNEFIVKKEVVVEFVEVVTSAGARSLFL